MNDKNGAMMIKKNKIYVTMDIDRGHQIVGDITITVPNHSNIPDKELDKLHEHIKQWAKECGMWSWSSGVQFE